MDPIIKVENLSLTYNLGKTNEAAAIQDINLEIFPGEYVILFGPSGCGKSTLLYCLTGLETPTKGRILIKDRDLSGLHHREMVNLRRVLIGMIFQQYNLITTISILDNVALPHILGGLPRNEAVKKAQELLERFGIGKLSHRLPTELSGGQQQRVAIARSLIYWPPVLFADEPVGNLDSQSSETVMKMLLELNEKDAKTVVLVTHDPSFLHFAHRVVHIKDGRVVRIVTNEERKGMAVQKPEKTVLSDIEVLAKSYPHLSEVEIKAKALAQYLLISLDEPEIKRLEKAIVQRISGELNTAQLKDLLDKPYEEGGVGLYKQTAQTFAQKIESILSEAKFLQQKVPAAKRPFTEVDIKVENLRRYLLDSSDIYLKKEEELNRLDSFIRWRMEKRIDRRTLEKYLDLPFKNGGVGLNTRTAREFAKRLELALVKY